MADDYLAGAKTAFEGALRHGVATQEQLLRVASTQALIALADSARALIGLIVVTEGGGDDDGDRRDRPEQP